MPRTFSEQLKSIRRSSAALLGVLGTLSLAFAPDAKATARPAEIVALTNLRPPAALVDQSSTDRDQLSQETLPPCASGTQFFDTTRQYWFDAGSGEYYRVISHYSRVIGTNCVLGADESWVFRLPVLANQTAQLPATIQLKYVPSTQNPNDKSYYAALHQTDSGLEYRASVDVSDMEIWKEQDDFGFRISVSGLSPDQLAVIFGFPRFEIIANQDKAYDGSPSPIDSSRTTSPQWIVGYRPASPDAQVSYTQHPDGDIDLALGGSSQITLQREFSKDDLVNRGIDFGSDLDVIPNLSGIDWSIVRRVRLELLAQGSLFYEIVLESPGPQSDNFRMRIAATTLAEWLNHPENSLRYVLQLEPTNFTGEVGVSGPVFWQNHFLEQGSHEASITDMTPGIGMGATGEVQRGIETAQHIATLLATIGLVLSAMGLRHFFNAKHIEHTKRELEEFIQRLLDGEVTDTETNALYDWNDERHAFDKQALMRLKLLVIDVLGGYKQASELHSVEACWQRMESCERYLHQLYPSNELFIRYSHEEPLYQHVRLQWQQLAEQLVQQLTNVALANQTYKLPMQLRMLLDSILQKRESQLWVDLDRVRVEYGSPMTKLLYVYEKVTNFEKCWPTKTTSIAQTATVRTELWNPFISYLSLRDFHLAELLLLAPSWPWDLENFGKKYAIEKLNAVRKTAQQQQVQDTTN